MRSVLISLITLFSFNALADYGVEIGFRQQSGDSSNSSATVISQAGLQGGFTASFPVKDNFNFRTGMLYTQRPLSVELGTTETKFNMNYIDFPITGMYKFEEYAGVFAGLHLSMNFDKSCSSDSGTTCSFDSVKSLITPFVVGVNFKFAPQLGATLYFESTGQVAEGLENYRAVGANLIIALD